MSNSSANKHIWIFGDSFADPKWSKWYKNTSYAWPGRLAKKYNVENYALKGTGPDWSFEQLLNRLKKGAPPRNTDLIYIPSYSERLNLKNFWKHDRQQVYLQHENSDFAKAIFKNILVDELKMNRELMQLGAPNLFAHLFDKVLIWPVATDWKLVKKFPVHQLATNVSVVDTSLRTLSIAEFSNPSSIDVEDTNRANHFSPENHKILLQQLCNWIDTATPINPSALLKNINL